ncbi:MAG: hypothetical protein HXY41_15590 [Chloroflexi bacterium]|nr:hypothetical protein [Chloroflexota bacterium]
MTKRFLASLGLLCLMLAGVVRGQEPTAQPEQNYIIRWEAEIIFPQAVRFDVVLARPLSEIGTLTLTVEPVGRPAVAVEVDRDAWAVVREPFSELAYLWPVSPAQPLRLSQDVHYIWQVVTRGGEVARIEDTFTFTDPRVTWAQQDGESFNLAIPADGRDTLGNVLGRLRADLQPVYDLLAEQTGRSESFNLAVYTTVPAGCARDDDGSPVAVGLNSRTEIPCDPAAAEAIFRASGLDVVQSDSPGANAIREAVVAYWTRRFYGWSNAPDWFAAGMAAFYSPVPRPGDLAILQAAARSDRLLAASALAGMPETDRELWLAQSHGLVLYIASRRGVPGLFRLAREAAEAASFDAVFEAAAGMSVSALLPDFQRWLFSDAALAAFGFTPYQDATPTPTATLTPTLTPTPTATQTPTLPPPTATHTPPGFVPTLTPLPSPTASRTPTAAPASVTPRPPGSLNTPTPVVVSPVEVFSTPAGILGLVSIGLLVIAILVVIFAGGWRR